MKPSIVVFFRGILPAQQHLVLNSMELEDKDKISECKIKDGTTIQLIPSMRGGPISFRRGS
jgi:Ubiquitin family